MSLEDHLGDILRKARKAANVPAETVAIAAGLSTAELAALEHSGQATKNVNLAALAAALNLSGSKLEPGRQTSPAIRLGKYQGSRCSQKRPACNARENPCPLLFGLSDR